LLRKKWYPYEREGFRYTKGGIPRINPRKEDPWYKEGGIPRKYKDPWCKTVGMLTNLLDKEMK